MSLSNLETLPEDILRLIVENLYEKPSCFDKFGRLPSLANGLSTASKAHGKENLSQLCLVCQKFRYLAQPIIFRHLTLTHSSSASMSDKQCLALATLLKTIITTPKLASAVKTLEVTEYVIECMSNSDEIFTYLKETAYRIAPQFQHTLDSLTMAQERRVYDLEYRYNGNAHVELDLKRYSLLVAIIIFHLPNLAKLSLGEAENIELFPSMLQALGAQSLNIIHLMTRLPPIQLPEMLKIVPRLEWLEIVDMMLPSMRPGLSLDEWKSRLPEMPNLKTLIFRDCLIHPPWLPPLLKCCNNGLHTFVYEQYVFCPMSMQSLQRDSREHMYWIDHQLSKQSGLWSDADMIGYLSQHKQTLRCLRLDFAIFGCYPDILPDLSAFHQLERLSMVVTSILRHRYQLSDLEVLPPNIRALQMIRRRSHFDDRRVVRDLENLVDKQEVGSKRYPHLEYVHVSTDINEQVVADLKHKFASKQITLEVDIQPI